MDWFKKKTEEAKQAASQAAAKLHNKRTTAFKGEGNVLGGGSHATPAVPSTAEPSSDAGGSTGKSFKLPFGSGSSSATTQNTPPMREEEKQRRREMQMKAAETRANAWGKKVNTARQTRLQKDEESESRFGGGDAGTTSNEQLPMPPPPSTGISADEVKARELQAAQSQLGFNPYAATFSSSREAGAAVNAIGGTAPPSSSLPPPAPALAPAVTNVADSSTENGAVFVLLRQEPSRAIAAAETIMKMLKNILQNPQEDKYRRVRLSNANIQAKLVNVRGAVELLLESGFVQRQEDGETFLVMDADQVSTSRIQSAIDRTEVALMQIQVDSMAT
ncbi:hypothetical protein ATCC90586_004552 [Pythium insidiosum]|nr:hypothetical protein ATCC90586_004552 [Pythium insidiosum]